MRRLDKELAKAGITFEADDLAIMRGPEHDVDRKLVEITGEYIITVTYSAVLDPRLDLWDRHTFDWVGSQNLYPDNMFLGERYFNKWGSDVACNDGELADYDFDTIEAGFDDGIDWDAIFEEEE